MIHSIFLYAAALTVFLSGTGPYQSRKYLVKEEQDNVTISYKWKRYGLFRKDDPPCLVLRITNHNPDRALVSFHIDYFWKAIRKAGSEEVEYCIRPESRIQGKMWDLVFSSGEFSESQVRDEMFVWEIADLNIVHGSDCKSRFNVKIQPDSDPVEGTD